MTNQATRIIVRAIGELAGETEGVHLNKDGPIESGFDDDDDDDSCPVTSTVHKSQPKTEDIDYKLYKPNVVGDDWIVSETDLCTF